MAKKQKRKKLPKLEDIKKKIKGKVYVGDGVKEILNERDSLKVKTQEQQKEIDSLKQVIKVRIK